jgi:hypothetical protein
LSGAAAYSKTFLAVTRKVATISTTDNHMDRFRCTPPPLKWNASRTAQGTCTPCGFD